jgi:hypothetical protein
MVRYPHLVVAFSAFAVVASAQPGTDQLRVLTSSRLEYLSYLARSEVSRGWLKTPELRARIVTIPPTESVLLTRSSDGGTVWYTDAATTRPQVVPTSKDEFETLWLFADGAMERIHAMKAGPVPVFVEKKVVTKDGKITTVVVTERILVVPKEDEVKAALAEIDRVANPAARATLARAAGARFAELFPPGHDLPAPPSATAAADRYRSEVLAEAKRYYTGAGATKLPAAGHPELFGKAPTDPTSVVLAAAAAKDVRTFKTDQGKFTAVWDGSTLVVVRQRPGFDPVDDNPKIEFSPDWLKSVDPRPRVKDFNLNLTDPIGPLAFPMRGTFSK